MAGVLRDNELWTVTDHNDMRYHQRFPASFTGTELVDFLRAIAEANSPFDSQFTYKVSCENKCELPFEDMDVSLTTGRIRGCFYLQGGRTYKDIKSFSYQAILVKFPYRSRSFSVSVY